MAGSRMEVPERVRNSFLLTTEFLALIHEPLSEWFGPGSVVERGNVTQLTYGLVPFRNPSKLWE